jgi:hypothetical protein
MAVYIQTTLECGHLHNPASYPGPIGGRNSKSFAVEPFKTHKYNQHNLII